MNPLRQKIEQEIRERGPIPFSRYMELCLYDPELGYYSRNAEQFGKAGDFYTSSDVHAVFGRLLARQFDEMWRALGSPERIELIELGPGRGLFAQDVLDWSEKKFPDFFHALRYILVESSPALRQRIARDEPAASADRGVEKSARTEIRGGTCRRISDSTATPPPSSSPTNSSTPSQSRFSARRVPCASTRATAASLKPGHSLRPRNWNSSTVTRFIPSRMNASKRLSPHNNFMDSIAASIQRGFLIAIDYGYTREEQLAGRHRGTLKALRQHSISANPYEAPGEQDITADVNFTALAAPPKNKACRRTNSSPNPNF